MFGTYTLCLVWGRTSSKESTSLGVGRGKDENKSEGWVQNHLIGRVRGPKMEDHSSLVKVNPVLILLAT